MKQLRDNEIEAFDEFSVKDKIDRWKGEPQPHLSATDTASRNVLIFVIQNWEKTESMKVTVRPSGTEPKVKMYIEVFGKPGGHEGVQKEKQIITDIRERLERAFMQYCYRLLDVDFPERGFLLFWQLPLNDKLKYFEIEEDIAKLKKIDDLEARKNQLDDLLEFLGADPIEKVDEAFKERYGAGIVQYLELI
jgi:phosphoglucomutase/phosphomannomutase